MKPATGRLLVVDRDPAVRDALSAPLTKAGHAVRSAARGDEALKLLEEEPSHAAVCELRLSDMDGLELLGKARAVCPSVEFVMTASEPAAGDEAAALRAGALHLLRKPVDPELLLLVAQAVLRPRLELEKSSALACLGELASGVAHELNNPLTSVIGFSKWLLKAKNLTDEQRGDLERIATESARCSRIIQNMLQFSRRRVVVPGPIGLEALLNDALELFKCATVGIAVSCEAPKPDLQVSGDRPRYQQDIIVCLGRARDSLAGRKTPKIGVRARREGAQAVIEIEPSSADGAAAPVRVTLPLLAEAA